MGNASRYWTAIVDGLDAGVIVLDRDRRIEGWNAWMKSATGKSIEEVRGQTLQTVFPDRRERPRLSAAVAEALGSGVSSVLTHVLNPQLFPLKTRAGRELLHDVAISAIGDGRERMCLIHVSDITMAVRRERYLRDRQNARYDAVVAGAPDAIVTMDGEGVIRLANPAAALVFGYTAQELIGRNVTMLFESHEAWAETWRAVLDDEPLRQPADVVALRKGGARIDLEVSASRWKSDSHVFVTAILRDVSERRAAAAALADLNATLEERVKERTGQLLQAEEALRQSQKMEAIGQLTGGIAHDFNNLLQGIIGTLDMVQKRVAQGRIGELDRFVKAALASAERASALTHRLLAFSRRQPIDPRPLNVNQLIGAIEELMRRSIGERVRMTIEASEDLWLVRCDANQLENALLNLAINARDAMPEGGTLTVATSNRSLDASQALVRDVEAGEYVCITITDTGAGMTPEVQARAFDPFFTTKPIGQGTGLGLSMIYGFVRQSNGSVRIDSRPGQGTTIEIAIPRFKGDLEPSINAQAAAQPQHAGKNQVVLVVEDEDIVRMLVVEVLNDLGYRALEVADGPAAVRILQSSQRIDLLITDIGLPELNGRQVVELARGKRSDLKVLYMTGYAESAAGSEFLEKGMQIICKPFTVDTLAAKIQEVIEQASG